MYAQEPVLATTWTDQPLVNYQKGVSLEQWDSFHEFQFDMPPAIKK